MHLRNRLSAVAESKLSQLVAITNLIHLAPWSLITDTSGTPPAPFSPLLLATPSPFLTFLMTLLRPSFGGISLLHVAGLSFG